MSLSSAPSNVGGFPGYHIKAQRVERKGATILATFEPVNFVRARPVDIAKGCRSVAQRIFGADVPGDLHVNAYVIPRSAARAFVFTLVFGFVLQSAVAIGCTWYATSVISTELVKVKATIALKEVR